MVVGGSEGEEFWGLAIGGGWRRCARGRGGSSNGNLGDDRLESGRGFANGAREKVLEHGDVTGQGEVIDDVFDLLVA